MIIDHYNKCLKGEYRSVDIIEHLPTLKQYAEQCSHVTEMGTRAIISTWALLAGHPQKMISYDVVHPLVHGGDLSLVYSECKEEGIEYEFILADVLKTEIEDTELLFIDTWHIYRQLKQELKLHSEKVRKYIILHDTATFGINGEDGGEGLLKALNEFLEISPEWKIEKVFTNNNGLTILKRK
jgi:hypothetical protein